MRCGRVCLSIVFLLLVIGIVSPFTSLFVGASGGAYRTPITITNNANTDLTDYQVKIVFDNTWDGWDHVANDGSDIYFMDSSNNPLYYWIESFDYSNQQAIIWVKVPNIPASSSITIYMYYGSNNPYLDYNDPKNVFLWYDDFEDGDLSEYNQYGNKGTPVIEVTSNAVEGSYSLHLAQNTNNAEHVGVAYKYQTFTNVRVHVKAVIDSRVDAGIFGILARFQGNDDSSTGLIDQSYYFTIGLRDDKAEISRNDINSGTTLATCSYNVEPGKVYELEAILYNDYLALYVDGSKVLEVNDNTYTSGYFGLVVIEADARFDTFYISKYVNPEPSISIGNSEEVSGSQRQYRTPIVISNRSNQNVIDYSIKIVLSATNWDGWNYVSNDASDIYFLDSNNDPLYYWIEEFDYTNKYAVIWVKVNLIANSDTIIYMYYGGDNTYNTYHDPHKVFLVFDDFSSDPTSNYVYSRYNFYNNFVGMYDISTIVSSIDTGLVLEYDIEPLYYISAQSYGVWIDIGLTKASSGDDLHNGVYPYSTMATTTYNLNEYKKYLLRSNGDGERSEAKPSSQVSVNTWYHVRHIVTSSKQELVIDGYADLTTTEPIDITQFKYIAVYGFADDVKLVQYDSTEKALIIQSYRDGKLNYKAYLDNIKLYKYVDPEPSISIGSSESVQQGDYPWFSANVSPTSVSVEPSQAISFDVNVTNTGSVSGWVVISLVDHNNVTRDSANITLDPGAWRVVTLSTTAEASNRGDWTWHIIGRNDTVTFFDIGISVSIHYSLKYSYSYTLSFNAEVFGTKITPQTFNYLIQLFSNINVGGISGIRYNYTLNYNAEQEANNVQQNRMPYLYGTSVCMNIYTNSTGNWSLVYNACGSTAYTLKFEFIYTLSQGAILDYPDAKIVVYIDYTGNGNYTYYTSVYIPLGNVSILLPSGYAYKLSIPASGQTIHGEKFTLQTYYIDNVQEPSFFVLDSNKVIRIYYLISTDPSNGGSSSGGGNGGSGSSNYPIYTNITLSMYSPSQTYSMQKYVGLIWGGDEFYYNRKIIDGLITTIHKESLSNVINLGTSLSSIVAQVGMKFTLQEEYDLPSDGVGVILNGYYSRGVGVFVNGTDIFVAETQYNKSSGKIIINDEDILWRDTVYLQGHLNIRYYVKLGYVNGFLYVLVNVYDLDRHIDTWYHAVLNYTIPGITHITFYNVPYQSNTSSTIEFYDDLIIMRGDYLRVTVDITPNFYIKINGTDRLGRVVTITCANNGPNDVDDDVTITMLADLPVIFPINGTLEIVSYKQVEYPPGKEIYNVIYPYGKIIVPKIETIQPYADPVRNTVGGILTMGLLLGVAIAMARTTVPTKHAILIASSILTFIGLILENTGIVGVSITAFLVTAVYSIKQRWEG